jgi:hypothetical protein
MKFKNKKKNYYRRLSLLAKAGMIADRSSQINKIPLGLNVEQDLNPVPMGLPVSLYPPLPITPSRRSSISSSEGNYVDAVDYEVELEKAEIELKKAQTAARSAHTQTYLKEQDYSLARAYYIRAYNEYIIYSDSSLSLEERKIYWAGVMRMYEERRERAKRLLDEATTKEAAAVALVAEREKELLEAKIEADKFKADEFKAAPKKSLSRRVIGATRKIMTTLRGSTRKSKAHK